MLVLFSQPPLSLRTAVLRLASMSTVTHCAPASAGYVLERRWNGTRIISTDAYVRAYPCPLWGVAAGAEPVEFPDIRSPYPWWGCAGRLLLPGVFSQPDDCVGLTVRLLQIAGIGVPSRISTPALLLRWLGRDHRVEYLG